MKVIKRTKEDDEKELKDCYRQNSCTKTGRYSLVTGGLVVQLGFLMPRLALFLPAGIVAHPHLSKKQQMTSVSPLQEDSV